MFRGARKSSPLTMTLLSTNPSRKHGEMYLGIGVGGPWSKRGPAGVYFTFGSFIIIARGVSSFVRATVDPF
jgi:hypothetical protein